MSKKIIFSVSATRKIELLEITSAFETSGVNLTLIFRDKQKLKKAQSYELNCPMVLYPNISADQNQLTPSSQSNSVYANLITDVTLHALLDRTGVKLNNEERYSYISRGILKTVNYLQTIKPDIVFFAAPPHHYDTWLFGRVAQLLNIRVGFVSFTIFKDIYIYCDGMPGSCHPKIIRGSEISHKSYKIKLARISKTFDKATFRGDLSMPETEARLYGKNKSKVFRPFRSFFETPRLLKRVIFTANLYKFFKRQIIEPEIKDVKYWIFFLHYQPERSTLPEGGLYFNQFEAIAKLRALLPLEITILVKEHPSTFRRLADPRYRNKDYYSNINSLTNTALIGFSQSSYDLIDGSCGVATITGKIAYEARCRGKASIIFGEGKYIGPITDLGIQHICLEKPILEQTGELPFQPNVYADWIIRYSVGKIDEQQSDSKMIRSNAIKSAIINLINELKNE